MINYYNIPHSLTEIFNTLEQDMKRKLLEISVKYDGVSNSEKLRSEVSGQREVNHAI